MESKCLEVVAACIRKDDRFLICQRPQNKARAGLWEFPGGKIEPGETKEQAILREIKEELGLELAVGVEMVDKTWEYPDLTIHLTLLEASVRHGEPQGLDHQCFQWITLEEAQQYEFCQADQYFIDFMRKASK